MGCRQQAQHSAHSWQGAWQTVPQALPGPWHVSVHL